LGVKVRRYTFSSLNAERYRRFRVSDIMDEASTPGRKQDLTPTMFAKLLRWLDPDWERAGAKYETIRVKLIKYFEWRGSWLPEDHADETINRVARKLEEGETVRTGEPYTYFQGVARLILLEALRGQEKERAALRHQPP